jgi:hypothetical protein
MRSLTRVSVVMGPPWFVSFVVQPIRRANEETADERHAASRKAPHDAGPDADRSRLNTACVLRRTGTRGAPMTGPLNRVWPTVGAGLHLLSLIHAGTVAHASLAAMTDGLGPESRATVPSAGPSARELADIPAVEVISRAAVMLMSAAAEKLGLAADDPGDSPQRDLDEARRLITALAGLVWASAEYLGPHAGPLRDGVRSLQLAFREYSAVPDEPGAGPGEKYTGRVN